MNREILFRGKRADNGEWIEGFYCKIDETTYAFTEDYKKYPVPTHHYIIVESMTNWGLPNRLSCVEVDSPTVCQYTGLTDKNGRKIFEGDILNDIDYGTMKCIYLHGSFAWYKEDGFRIECMRYVPVIEVIGNIFDNPELLED